MVTQITRPSHNGHKAKQATNLNNGTYTISQRLCASEHRTLFLGVQQGVERPVLIERIDAIAAPVAEMALAHRHVVQELCHSNIAQFVDAFAEQGAFYTIQCAGSSGTPLSAQASLTPAQVAIYGIHMCNALSYLEHHHMELVAADIAPSSIFITSSGRARLTALAALLGVHAEAHHSPFTARQATEPAATVFSLGATLHHSLTNWSGNYRAGAPAITASRTDVAPELNAVIMRALAPNLTERYTHIADLRLALLRFQ